MNGYIIFLVILSVIICILFAFFIFKDRTNIVFVGIICIILLLLGGIVACLFLINDLLNQLNSDSKSIKGDLNLLKTDVTNLGDSVDQFSLDLTDAANVLLAYVAANPPERSIEDNQFEDNQIVQIVEEQSIEEKPIEEQPVSSVIDEALAALENGELQPTEKAVLRDRFFTESMQQFVDVLDRNTKKVTNQVIVVQQAVQVVNQDVAQTNDRIDNINTEVVQQVVNQVSTNPEVVNQITTVVAEDVTQVKNDITTIQQIINNIPPNVTTDLTEVKDSISALQQNIDTINNTVTEQSQNLELIDGQLGQMYDFTQPVSTPDLEPISYISIFD